MKNKIKITLIMFLMLATLVFNLSLNFASPMSVFSTNSLDEDEKNLYSNEWVKINGFYYFYDFNGNKVKNNWVKDINDWYYVDIEGKMQKSTWINDSNNDWFYVGDDGKMQKSKWIENKYYVDENGKMLKDSVYKIGSKNYIFDNNGVGIEIPPETKETKSYSNNYSNKNKSSVNRTSDITVYVTGKGKRYHISSSCSNMKGPKAISRSEAVSRGYSACNKCW